MRSLQAELKALGLRPSKRRGQNFLVDAGVLQKIVAFAGIKEGDLVLEIGPGLGALTEKLLERTTNLIALELEEKLQKRLSVLFPDLRCFNRDVLRTSPEEFFEKPCVVVSNVPYSISSDVILWLLKHQKFIERANLLLQREFVERLLAAPGTKSYGRLSVLTDVYCDKAGGPIIPGDAFFPRARVDSGLIELRFLEQPRVEIADEEHFVAVVQAAFAHRRKNLVNCLQRAGYISSKEEGIKLLDSLSLSANIRGEALDVYQFANLARNVKKASKGDGSLLA